VGKENTGAKQTHKCCNRLNHRKNPSRPRTNTTPPYRAQSKGFRGWIEDPAGVMLWHNSFAGEGNRADAGDLAMGASAHASLEHFRLDLPCLRQN
jgi:hypothetical protein